MPLRVEMLPCTASGPASSTATQLEPSARSETVEDLESQEDLTHLFTIFKGVVMLNSTNVYEVLLPYLTDAPLPRAVTLIPYPRRRCISTARTALASPC